jgi:hypothetical protein
MCRRNYQAQRRVAIMVSGDPVERVCVEYRDGATIPVLATRYGVATGTIWYWLRKGGAPRVTFWRKPTQFCDHAAVLTLIAALVTQARRDTPNDPSAAAWLRDLDIPTDGLRRIIASRHTS